MFNRYISFIGDWDGLPLACFVCLSLSLCLCLCLCVCCVPVKLLSCIVSGAGDDFPLAGQARMPKALEMGRCLYGEHLQHHIGATTPYLFIRGAATTPCLDYHTRATTLPMVTRTSTKAQHIAHTKDTKLP